MKTALSICFLLFSLITLAQPTRLELGMRRNAAQTLMGKAKLDLYKKEKSIYAFADSVFFCIEFNGDEYCSGFFWSAKNKNALEKIITENGFTKKDSVSFGASDFKGLFKKEEEGGLQTTYRFIADTVQQTEQQKKPIEIKEETPKEKPFYGFTILGAKVWEKK
jgi:hypothetical protein